MSALTAYRLSIAPPLAPFTPEITYACDFLDHCHHLVRSEDAARVLHYGPGAPPGAVAVPAAVFPDGVRIAADGLHPEPGTLERLITGCGPAPIHPDAALPDQPTYDAIGLIFLMLSRLEERAGAGDRYGRFRHDHALAHRLNRPGHPLADEAAFDLARWVTGDDRPRSRTTFAVLPTHDVDRLRSYHNPWQPLRQAAGDLVKRRRPLGAWRRLTRAYGTGEPGRSVAALMSLSEQHGLTSRFFFMGPSRSSHDSPYAISMPGLLRRTARDVAERGHIVGLHPGYAAATDPTEWSRQRWGLESVVGAEVSEGRQHMLRYRADLTPEIWDQAGMTADYTLAFPEVTGFRSGTCRGYHPYSLRRRKALSLIQHDTAIADFGLFGGKYRDLTVEGALDACAPAIDACRRFGGTLVLLYHTGQMRAPRMPFYRQLLDCV